jgi:hypothetical protein
MLIACWIPKATNTHPEYLILFAFPLQQRLHERASVLCYTDIACLVETCLIARERASSRSKRVQELAPQFHGLVALDRGPPCSDPTNAASACKAC